jgi:flavin reductase (DIM6/NTAB) family NADH-FMN oxidoreductase RutF
MERFSGEPEEKESPMQDKIIEAMSRLSYGIYIVTTLKESEKHGMIASWVSQVSHTPPLVMVAIRTNRRMHPIVQEAGAFALHVLDVEDKQTIGRFKMPKPEQRFQDAGCSTLETGCPVLTDKLACMDCRLVDTIDVGDHTLFIGEVLAAGVGPEGTPMTSWDYGKVYLGDS